MSRACFLLGLAQIEHFVGARFHGPFETRLQAEGAQHGSEGKQATSLLFHSYCRHNYCSVPYEALDRRCQAISTKLFSLHLLSEAAQFSSDGNKVNRKLNISGYKLTRLEEGGYYVNIRAFMGCSKLAYPQKVNNTAVNRCKTQQCREAGSIRKRVTRFLRLKPQRSVG